MLSMLSEMGLQLKKNENAVSWNSTKIRVDWWFYEPIGLAFSSELAQTGRPFAPVLRPWWYDVIFKFTPPPPVTSRASLLSWKNVTIVIFSKRFWFFIWIQVKINTRDIKVTSLSPGGIFCDFLANPTPRASLTCLMDAPKL